MDEVRQGREATWAPGALEVVVWTVCSAALVAGAWSGRLETTVAEALGFVTGAVCVYLVVRQSVWNFPFGIATSAIYLVVFWQARLFGDAALQSVYIALNAHGWYSWLRGGADHTPLEVSRASRLMLAGSFGFVVTGTAALSWALRAASGAAPVLDALTTSMSLAAQFLLNRKVIENWYVWIAADVIYIYLYATRGLYLTAVLYFVFLCMCVAGVVAWRRSLKSAGGGV